MSAICLQEGNWGGYFGLGDLEGTTWRRAMRVPAQQNRAELESNYSISVLFVKELLVNGLDSDRYDAEMKVRMLRTEIP